MTDRTIAEDLDLMQVCSALWRGALAGLGLGLAMGLLLSSPAARADTDLPSKFSNIGTIGNTRHNLTQRQVSGGGPAGTTMDSFRNDYQEVCVYCHTPHGANRTTTAPLWNRTMKATTYSTYDLLNTASLTQPVSQPGVNSLTCLSWAYSWRHFVDHRHGAWYRILDADNRKYSDEKSPAGKVDYHTMGACYEVLNVVRAR